MAWHCMAWHRFRLMNTLGERVSMKIQSQYMQCSAILLLRLGVSSCFQKSRSSVTAQSCLNTISFHSPRTMSPPPLFFTTRDLRSLRFPSRLFHRPSSRFCHSSPAMRTLRWHFVSQPTPGRHTNSTFQALACIPDTAGTVAQLGSAFCCLPPVNTRWRLAYRPRTLPVI